jgi:hypothetical protein
MKHEALLELVKCVSADVVPCLWHCLEEAKLNKPAPVDLEAALKELEVVAKKLDKHKVK